MTAEIFVDFLEYGKRFLYPGTTDYVVLEYSDDYMLQGIVAGANILFLDSDGLGLLEKTNFNDEIGRVSVALVQLNRDFGGLKKPYLFVQIQSRREDELDGGNKNSRMHRNFNQIRFTLLAKNEISQKLAQGYALYASLLHSAEKPKSPHSWKDFSLNDHERQVTARAIGKKNLYLNTTNDYIKKYFPSLEDIYYSDLSLLIDKLLSHYQNKSAGTIVESVSIEVSKKEKLLQSTMLLYTLLLAQDVQAYFGWYFSNVLTFSLDNITNRSVKIKFYGHPSNISVKNNYFEVMKELFKSGPDLLKNVLNGLYSPLMEALISKQSIETSLEVFKIVEGDLDDDSRLHGIEKRFDILLDPYPDDSGVSTDKKVKFLLYRALDKVSNDSKRSFWIRKYKDKVPESIYPLVSYLEFRNYNDEFILNFSDLNESQVTRKIEGLFLSTIEKHTSWRSLFEAFGKVPFEKTNYLFNHKLSDVSIGGKSFLDYIMDELLEDSTSLNAMIFFEKQLEFKDFRDKILVKLDNLDAPENILALSLKIIEKLQILDFPKPLIISFYTNCLDIILVNILSNIQIDKRLLENLKIFFEKGKGIFGKEHIYMIDVLTEDRIKKLNSINSLFIKALSDDKLFKFVDWWLGELVVLIDRENMKLKENIRFEDAYIELVDKYRAISTDTSDFGDTRYLLSLGETPSGISLSSLGDIRFIRYKDNILQIWEKRPASVKWAVDDVEYLAGYFGKSQSIFSDNALLTILEVCKEHWKKPETNKFSSIIARQWIDEAHKRNWEGLPLLYELFKKHPNQLLGVYYEDYENKGISASSFNKLTQDCVKTLEKAEFEIRNEIIRKLQLYRVP